MSGRIGDVELGVPYKQTGGPGPAIRTRAKSACAVCGSPGEIAYSGLRDRLFGVAGEWSLRCCRNHNCGLFWLDPMPIDEDLPRLYESYYTHSQAISESAGLRRLIKHSYWAVRYGDGVGVGLRARLIAGLVRLAPGLSSELNQGIFELPLTRGGRLLEIGCGNGSAMRRMAELGWVVQGVDFDETAVQLARSCGLDVRLGGLEAQDYPSASFDAVVMSHVFEHVPDPRALLTECRRIVKPGGRLVSITPNVSSWGHKIFGRDWLPLDPPRHLHLFTSASLRKLAGVAGWHSVVVKTSIANAFATIQASYRLRRDGKFNMAASSGNPGDIDLRMFQAAAALRHWFLPESGEELVLHATRTASGGN